MTCPTPPHAGKGGDRLGIYLIVEVITLPLGPIYWVNPHIYFVRAEGKRNIRLARETRIYLSLKCSPHSKKRPRMYLLSTQLAQSSPSQASFYGASLSEPHTYRTAVQNHPYIYIPYTCPSPVCLAGNLVPRRAPLNAQRANVGPASNDSNVNNIALKTAALVSRFS